MSHHDHHRHQARTLRELLRELRGAAVVAVSADTREADRRARTIARMAELQALRRAERSPVGRRVRPALIAAALVPVAASAAWMVRGEGPEGPRAAHSVPASPVTPALVARQPARAPEPSPVTDIAEGARAPHVAEAPASRRPPATGTFAPPRPGAAASTLPEENALLEGAMAARRRGQAARAVELLDALLHRFPHTPLRAGAEVERFRALAEAGMKDAAVRAARRYLASHPEGAASEEARRLAVERVEGSFAPAPERKP